MKAELGPDVPLHFSQFHPEYLLKNLPPTPVATLERAKAIVDAEGLHYVYIGNIPGHPAESTYCPKCRRVVVERAGFTVRAVHLNQGKCPFLPAGHPGHVGWGASHHEISSYRRDRGPVVRGGIPAASRRSAYAARESPKVRPTGGGRVVLSGRSRGIGEDDRRFPGQGHAAAPWTTWWRSSRPTPATSYAGPVAAYSYALLKGRKFDRVVVIAPSHYEAFDFASVYDGAAYTTPLGQVPVDQAFAAKLARASRLIRLSGAGHTPRADKPEHSLEVQLPFLQKRDRAVPACADHHGRPEL